MDPSDALIGRTIAGKILIEKLVGRGAMGSVYRGRHLALEESVAVKVMHPEYAGDPGFAERFRREATTMVRLKHPNSVRVLDFGEEPDGLLYLAMEYLDGRDLGAMMRTEWPMAPARIAHLLRQALGALQAAHDAEIIHRDLKPENILVVLDRDEEGAPTEVAKVCDFGIAKIRDARSIRPPSPVAPTQRSQRLTSAGFVVGTPEYMSPEQGRADPLDARSDIYSMGVILYELLTGRIPFEAENAVGIILRHVSDAVTPPSEIVPRVDPTLEAICLKALRKVPDERFATAREMRAALRAIDDAAPPTHKPLRPLASLPRGGTETALQVDAGMVDRDAATQAVIAAPAKDAARSRRPRSRALVLVPLVVISFGAIVAIRVAAGTTVAIPAAAFSIPSGLVSTTLASGDPAPIRAEAPPPPTASTDPRPLSTPVVRADLSLPFHSTTSPSVLVTATSDPTPIPTTSAAPTPPPIATSTTPTASSPIAAPPPTPAPPPFDASTARVAVTGVGNVEGVLKSAVSAALGRTTGAMTVCYRAGLARATSAESGGGSIHMETDDSGIVTSATARVSFSPAVARCIERAVVGARFAGVDTGSASADVSLTFEVH